MNIREISKPVTAASLNESLARRFGQRIALEKFTLEQLQDARNKVRTKLSQVETNESFNTVHKEAYQKSKLFLDVLNAEILEREHIGEKAESKAQQKAAGAALAAKRGDGKAKGASKEMMKMSTKELKKIAGTKHKGLPDKKTESVIREGAEESAELVMAAKDMVDRITGWMEDTAEMQTQSMLELADSIRDEMGSEQSEAFLSSVKPSLEALFAALEGTREALTSGVGVLTGEGAPAEPMGAEEEPAMEPTVDAEAGAEVDAGAEAGGDEFAAAEPAAGGEEEAGRARRESVERSRKLASILTSKKK
jgi:hypothetical protein